MAEDLPFPYLGHGVLSPEAVGKVSGAYLGFTAPVPAERRAAVMAGCPAPINGIWFWGPTLASCESDGDVFDQLLAERYAGGDVGAIDLKAVTAFAADVEAWARGVHAQHPLAFFVGPVGADQPSAWGTESARIAPKVMIPFLETYAAENAADLDEHADDVAPGVFNALAMSCLLPSVPKTPDRELSKRLDRLRARFGLAPKGTMVILPI